MRNIEWYKNYKNVSKLLFVYLRDQQYDWFLAVSIV
jgi:hypothetical protein